MFYIERFQAKAWDKERRIFAEDILLHPTNDIGFIVDKDFNVVESFRKERIQAYWHIGKTDINGNKIYLGDIFRYVAGVSDDGQVIYDYSYLIWDSGKLCVIDDLGGMVEDMVEFSFSNVEVVGHIRTHSDLAKQAKDHVINISAELYEQILIRKNKH